MSKQAMTTLQNRRLPNGDFTNNSEEWAKAWTQLGDKFTKAIGRGSACAFDPDILVAFTPEENTPSITIPVWLAERVIALDEGRE